jgi:hypothetical protein
MAISKKQSLAGTAPAAKKGPVLVEGSAFSKHPLGKLVELLRDIPARKIKVWPVKPQ